MLVRRNAVIDLPMESSDDLYVDLNSSESESYESSESEN